MGKIAFILSYFLCTLPNDVYENRKHLHVVLQQNNKIKILAKIWLEKNNKKCIEFIHPNKLSSKEEKIIIKFIDDNYDKIINSLNNSFEGIKVKIIK